MCELTKEAYEQDCKPLAPIVIDLRETSVADALQQEAQRDCERAIRMQGLIFGMLDAVFSAARKRP